MLFLTLAVPLAAASAPLEAEGQARLIAACQSGDRRAQERFYRLHYASLLTVCRRYAADEQRAADYVNRAFLRALAKLDSYAGTGSLNGWLRRLTVNVCLNELRKTSRITEELSEAVLPDAARVNPAAFDRMKVEDIIRLVQSLPERQRVIFNLVAIEGFRHVEVAKQLNMSADNSRYHFAAARQRLQHLITQQNLRTHE